MRVDEALATITKWRRYVIIVVIFDIFAGVVANFTISTSWFYAVRGNNASILFLALHAQPVLLAWLWQPESFFGKASFMTECSYVWAYTIACGVFVRCVNVSSLFEFASKHCTEALLCPVPFL